MICDWETSLNHIATIRKYSSAVILRTALLAVAMAFPGISAAAERFQFENVNIYKSDGRYYLDADTTVRMRRRPAEALEKGVSLYFDMQISVIRQRTWWPDSTVRSISKRYRLFYFELTRHYRVTEIYSGETRSFRTLDEAKEYLGNIEGLPLIAVNEVKNPSRYRIQIQIKLDISELPAPLQIQAYTTRRWRLQSDVTAWPLD